MKEIKLTRRNFLKVSGASIAVLSLNSFGFLGGNGIANATEKIINETKPSFTLPKKTSGKTHNKNPKRILFRKKSIAF